MGNVRLMPSTDMLPSLTESLSRNEEGEKLKSKSDGVNSRLKKTGHRFGQSRSPLAISRSTSRSSVS